MLDEVITIGVVLIGLIFIAITQLFYSNEETPQVENISLVGKNLIGNQIPHTTFMHYTVPKGQGPFYIDWDDIPTDASKTAEITKLENDSGVVSHTYYYKDLYDVRLLDENFQELKKIQIIIHTDGWDVITSYSIHYTKLYDKGLSAIASPCMRTNSSPPSKSDL